MEAHTEQEPDPLAAMPPVPAKTTFSAKSPPAYDAATRLPAIDESKVEAMSNAADKERLQDNLKTAGAMPDLQRIPCALLVCIVVHAVYIMT